jgi:septum formation protein
MKVILASASPRRRELLGGLGIEFEVVPSDASEDTPEGRWDRSLAARRIAHRKAATVARSHPEAIVIGADTLVCLAGAVLGKPEDEEDAKRMLRALSGKTHKVITGVAACSPSATLRGSETTLVTFRHVMEHEIREYVATGEPMDKAGAYGIQGKAGAFVAAVHGCYYNVVGLPVLRLARMLRALGVEINRF